MLPDAEFDRTSCCLWKADVAMLHQCHKVLCEHGLINIEVRCDLTLHSRPILDFRKRRARRDIARQCW